MISAWKRQLLDSAAELFDKNQKCVSRLKARSMSSMEIGQLKVENDFLARKHRLLSPKAANNR